MDLDSEWDRAIVLYLCLLNRTQFVVDGSGVGFVLLQNDDEWKRGLREWLGAQMISEVQAKEMVALHGFKKFRGISHEDPLLVICEQPMRFLRLSLQEHICLHLDQVVLSDSGGKSIEVKGPVVASSIFENRESLNGSKLCHGEANGGVSFHSEHENCPWIVIDIGRVVKPVYISVYNRSDFFFWRASSLKIEVSTDLYVWSEVYNNWAVLNSEPFLNLGEEDRALVSCAVYNVSPVCRLIDELRMRGESEKALELLRIGNSILKEDELALGPHGLTQTFGNKNSDQLETIYHSLSELLRLLNDEFGVTAFPSSGTLLGLFRDGKLLDHDDDLDICYISKFQAEEGILEERESIARFLEENQYKVSCSDIAHLWVQDRAGVRIDVFTGWIEGEKVVMNPLPRRGVETTDILPLEVSIFSGETVHLPRSPESLMILNYGESWRVPDPLWRFDWSRAKEEYGFLYFKR